MATPRTCSLPPGAARPTRGCGTFWATARLGQRASSSTARPSRLVEDPLFLTVVDQRPAPPSAWSASCASCPSTADRDRQHLVRAGDPAHAPGHRGDFLLARHAFDDLRYRRLEWKCNALNARSRRAALRFGFSSSLFRQHMVIKDRSRDTTWFAMLDDDWPVRAAFAAWLDPANFDAAGRSAARWSRCAPENHSAARRRSKAAP